MGHGGANLGRGGRGGEACVPGEHGVVVDVGAGHFGEQTAGIARAAEEEMQRKDVIGELSGVRDDMLETREADVEEEASFQGGE